MNGTLYHKLPLLLLILFWSAGAGAQTSFNFIPGTHLPEVTFDAGVNGARIYNDIKLLGESPLTLKLDPGIYNLKVMLDGHIPASTRVRVEPNVPQCLFMLNSPTPEYGDITIKSNPGECQVFIDGKAVGTTPYSGKVLAMEHEFRLSKNGYADEVWSEVISKNKTTAYTKDLIVNRSRSGKLSDGTQYSGKTCDVTGNSKGLPKSFKEYFSGKTFSVGTMRDDGAGIAVFGKNDYIVAGTLTSGFSEYLQEAKSNGWTIKDVHLTSKYGYILLSNDGWTGIFPKGCREKMLEMRDRSRLRSASFNDNGDFVVVSESEWYSSSYTNKTTITEAVSLYGKVLHVHLTDKGIAVTCEKGVYFKNAPEKLIDRLNSMNVKPTAVKFTDGGKVLMYNNSGRYSYFM